ncbi:MAG: response regulator [Ilumatobacter sp.]|jgi:DNA-binding NarL/FixJ family response regulator|uniref:response regulator n=1 Tax=Ilumatobacter sp. TaxID=1967498 RepID=UPI00391D2CC3
MIRVMLVDDQAMVRTGFRMILEAESDLTVVGEAVDGLDAVEMVDRARPDVVLMDVRMPRMDGIEACQRICRPSTTHEPAEAVPRVMMLTTFDLDDYVHAALRAGASGFMLKDAPPEQLVDGIRIIANGDALLAPSVTQALIDEIARRPASQPDAFPGINELTEREIDVIKLMAKGLSNAEIASALFLGEATIKTHVGRILAKLHARDRVQAVVAAYESGLVVPGE